MRPTIRAVIAPVVCVGTLLGGCTKNGEVKITDENNYYFLADVTAGTQTITAQEDTFVDWSGLTVDIRERDMDPASEVSVVRILRFTLTQDEVIEGINRDNLRQSDVSGNADYEVSGSETGADLSTFLFLGTPFPPATELVDTDDAYLVSVISVDEESGYEDYRMFTFIDPVTDAPPAEVIIDNASASLDYTVDIDGVPAVETEGSTLIDWTSLTQTPSDDILTLSNIDAIMLAQYDTATVADLEADFLHIEEAADRLFYGDVSGKGEFDLLELTDQDGNAFEGFDDTLWLIALRCGTCISPAPLFLGVIR
jgi:hypothetical protein